MSEIPPHGCPRSRYIVHVKFESAPNHKGDGDSWPLTWAADDNMYGAAGDNQRSPMNFWRIEDDRSVWLVNNLPVDPKKYCEIPPAHPTHGIKPAGLLSVGGVLYFAVEAMNYGEETPDFPRQRNIHGWIVTSTDFGKTWNCEATPTHFFTGRVSSCHFIQFGKDYAGARDEYVYASFCGADDGNSYWENGDYLLLGRVHKDRILDRSAWEFCAAVDEHNRPSWDADERKARQMFRYPLMTGENHISYNEHLGRYLMGNYGFTDEYEKPRPYHAKVMRWGVSLFATGPSQLTLFEAPEPWGPWSVFYRDDNWGNGGYQPIFPPKWMHKPYSKMTMVYSGSGGDYNFTTQGLSLELDERYR